MRNLKLSPEDDVMIRKKESGKKKSFVILQNDILLCIFLFLGRSHAGMNLHCYVVFCAILPPFFVFAQYYIVSVSHLFTRAS